MCVYSDHDFVYIEFNLNTADCRGPGVWKFNNSLLQDDKFCSSVSDLIDHFLRFRSSFTSDLVMWDQLKCNIKNFTINYSRERWRQLSREKISAINHLSFLKRRLAAVVLKLNLKFGIWRFFLSSFLINNWKAPKLGAEPNG